MFIIQLILNIKSYIFIYIIIAYKFRNFLNTINNIKFFDNWLIIFLINCIKINNILKLIIGFNYFTIN